MFNLPVSSKYSEVDGYVGIRQIMIHRYRRVIAGVLLFIAILYPGELGEITRISIFDAYTQVSVFVAFTLLIFFGLEHFLKVDAGELMKKEGVWQVPIASCLGALPGCGGAVVAITAFARGNITPVSYTHLTLPTILRV